MDKPVSVVAVTSFKGPSGLVVVTAASTGGVGSMTGAAVTGASAAMVVVMGTAGVMVAVTDTLTGVVVVMVVAGGMLTAGVVVTSPVVVVKALGDRVQGVVSISSSGGAWLRVSLRFRS